MDASPRLLSARTTPAPSALHFTSGTTPGSFDWSELVPPEIGALVHQVNLFGVQNQLRNMVSWTLPAHQKGVKDQTLAG